MNRPPRREEPAPEARRGVCPVYREVQEVLRPRPPATANTGLIFDRYTDVWSGAPNWKPETPQRQKSARQRFLDEVVGRAEGVAPQVAPLLQALHERRAALWQSLDARAVDLTLATPLVSGIGMTHALEVGFVWDRNLGIPYLPATSLKGAARSRAEDWEGMDPAAVVRIFGDHPTEAAEAGGAGSVVFHALYPVAPPRLRVDVLNPHFAEYYQGRATQPGDWLAPVPVFFLTVLAGTRFRTALHPRPDAIPGDVEEAERCVREALGTLGIGAKTAVGYGLFKL